MTITMLKAKIHRATVTQAELDYVGSITVDMDLLEQAGIPGITRRYRSWTSTTAPALRPTRLPESEAAACDVSLNGAAARMVQTGDKIILMAYA